MARSLDVMKSERGNMLSSRVLKGLDDLVESALLQTLDVIGRLLVRGKLKLVEVQFVTRTKSYQLIIIVKLSTSYLFCEHISLLGLLIGLP